ncbi:amidohydrolase [Dehalococcoidia bacterium]|nr:amidohydrolase [Dehalococcoidia bacterium]
MTPSERKENGATMGAWWFMAGNTLDRATGSLPRLMAERLDEMGIDFTVLYGTLGLGAGTSPDEEMRRAMCRAVNMYQADLYREFSDRMTPAAVIPMYTPEEAIDELEYAVEVLGLKTAVIGTAVLRPIQAVHRVNPDFDRFAYRVDNYALDSEYDYDPFWAKCVELKVAPSAHASGAGWGSRQSPSNYMYNQIGKFWVFGDAFCKALFLGGVTRRFPELNIGFMEGGVGWAATLFADLVGRWEKRGAHAIRDLDPKNLNREVIHELLQQYPLGTETVTTEQILEDMVRFQPHPEELDDWRACGLDRREDLYDLFVPRFYFGCEADDPMNHCAFNTKANPFGARLNAMFGSDIGHWDVPDMADVLTEAYEMVEKEIVSGEDFKDFAFSNVVRFYGEMNPDFYKGTRVEGDAAKLLAR